MINANVIQKTSVNNKFLISSTKNISLLYIINSKIGMCFYLIEMSSTSCKYQRIVSIKYHILIFNFILLLMPDDHIIYAYITFGT